MKRSLILLCAFALGCQTEKAGPQGAKGDTGLTGPQGATGAKGDAGAAGVCTNCSSLTSIDGLSGGTVTSPTTFPSITTGSIQISGTTPTGIVISIAGSQNSVGGFYCGTTASVDGNIFGAGSPYDTTEPYSVMPKRRAKKLCEDTCNNSAAHPCLSTEIQNAQFLNGGGGVGANSSVPIPPTSVTGWVLSPDPTASCNDLAGTHSNTGTTYSQSADEGRFVLQACDTPTHGLFCCL